VKVNECSPPEPLSDSKLGGFVMPDKKATHDIFLDFFFALKSPE